MGDCTRWCFSCGFSLVFVWADGCMSICRCIRFHLELFGMGVWLHRKPFGLMRCFYIILYIIYNTLYNKPSYSRILIDSGLWSIRGQTDDWLHHKFFSVCILKWRKVWEIRKYFMWLAEDKVQKRLVEALNRYKKQEVRISRFFLENVLSSLNRQLSETKPKHKIDLAMPRI